MTLYFDSSAPGGEGPITESETVWSAGGGDVQFYISVASNINEGQASGPPVEFILYSKKNGRTTFNVDYGGVNSNWGELQTGYMVECVVPTSGGPVSLRVVISSGPTQLAVQGVAALVVNPYPSGVGPQSLVAYVGTPGESAGNLPVATSPGLGVLRVFLGCGGSNFTATPAGELTPVDAEEFATPIYLWEIDDLDDGPNVDVAYQAVIPVRDGDEWEMTSAAQPSGTDKVYYLVTWAPLGAA